MIRLENSEISEDVHRGMEERKGRALTEPGAWLSNVREV
jgi:hypothetical protein